MHASWRNGMTRKLTEKQKRVFQEGDKAEREAAKWLKEHGFDDVKRNPAYWLLGYQSKKRKIQMDNRS